MTTLTDPGHPPRPAPGWWWALVPLVVAPVGLLGPDGLLLVSAAVVGAGVVAAASRHPGPALVALVVAAGLQPPIQALLLHVLPAGAVRAAGFTKEALLAGLVVAGWQAHRRRGHRLDRVDRAMLAFVLLVAAYLVVPLVLSPVVRLFPRAPTGAFTLGLAARANAGMVLVLLATRSLDVSREWRRRVVGTVIAVALVAALASITEFVATDLWQRVENQWLELPRLRALVFDAAPDASPMRSLVAGRLLVRAGAWSDALTVGFFLVPGLALALVRAANRPSLLRLAVAATIGAGIVATLTRSAFLAAVVMALVVALGFPRTQHHARTRLLAIGSLGLILALAFAGSTGLVERTTAAFTGDDASATDHVESTTAGIERALDHPFGLGLGVQPNARRGSSGGQQVVTENAYLQVANELGAVAAILLVVALWRLVVALRRRGDEVATAMAGTVAGVAVAGLFLHVWLPLDGPWTMMALAGLWLPRRPGSAADTGEHAEQG